MNQIKQLFASLTLGQKIGLAAVILLVAGGVPMFTRWQHEGSFKPLFTGMAPEDAGAIVQKLKESGVEHRLAENGTAVLVPADKVDDVRLEMAGAGLPRTGRIGFELFDKTNLGLTDFSERVNYRRAVEGELERTIKAINEIEQARVHVTFPKDSVFLDSREPAKASVLLHVKPGLRLSPPNVVAIENLVASAVEGLSPDAVSIVDMQGNLLSRQHKGGDGTDSADNALDYKHQVEKDLTAKVESTLTPLLGDGKFRVGITADCDFSTSEQTDEVYDPTRSVMSNSQKTEDVSQGGGGAAAGGVPGTPANLPRSTIRAQATGGGGNSVSRRTENVSFETSRTVRQVKVPRGTIKRISAALLVDQDVEWQGKGKQRKRVLIPPTPEKLKTIHDVVAGVLGIVNDRGDQLVVETLPFEQTRNAEDSTLDSAKPIIPTNALKDLMADKKVLIGAGVGVLFIVLFMVFRMTRKSGNANAHLHEKPVILPGRAEEHRSARGVGAGAAETAEAPKPGPEIDGNAQGPLQLPVLTNNTKTLLENLKRGISKDPETAVNVIRGWIEEA
jgi:flagellar M-ring protein FliF